MNITDSAQIQQIHNSIAEGEMILKSGKKTSGKKYSTEELIAIKNYIDKIKKNGGTINWHS